MQAVQSNFVEYNSAAVQASACVMAISNARQGERTITNPVLVFPSKEKRSSYDLEGGAELKMITIVR